MDNKSDFTISLALVDAIPVILFSITIAVLASKLQSAVYLIGAIMCILAGTGKVLWKMLIAVWNRDVPILGAQLRFLMPAGFLLMIAGVIKADRSVVKDLISRGTTMPCLLLFLLAIAGMIGMMICTKKYDRKDVKGNWIEQGINCCVQGCVMIGVLML